MSMLEFVASVTKSLAWPAAALLIAMMFRRQVRGLLSGRARKLRVGPVELEMWDEGAAQTAVELTLAEDEARPALPEGAPDTSNVGVSEVPTMMPPGMDELPRVATHDPEAAVVAAFKRVERELRETLTREGATGHERMSGVRLAQLANRMGLISDDTMSVVRGLAQLRNLAAHEHVPNIDVNRALEYLSTAARTVRVIQSEVLLSHGLGLTAHQVNGGAWKATVVKMSDGTPAHQLSAPTFDEARSQAAVWSATYEPHDSDSNAGSST